MEIIWLGWIQSLKRNNCMSETTGRKTKKTGIIVAIAAVSTLLMSFSMQAGILSAIAASFPQADDAQIQLIHSICSLAAMPSMFGVVKLSEYISKKKCVLIGVAILIVGGLLPLLLHSHIWMLYVSSILIGFGMGFINISTATLISEHFSGPDKGRVMGIQAALQGVGAALYSVLGGAIADWINWKWSFLVFLLGIPALILFAILMPEDKPVRQEKSERTPFLTKQLIILIALNFLFNLTSTGFQSNISMFIDVEGLGSVTLSGVLNAFFMVVGVPVGFALGAYMQKLKRWSNVIVAGVASIGMILIFFSHSLVPVIIGTFLTGVAFAAYAPANMTFVCSVAKQENVSRSVATSNAFSCVARFASPVVINFITRFFGGGIRTNFIVSGIGLAAVFVLLLILNPVKNSDLE